MTRFYMAALLISMLVSPAKASIVQITQFGNLVTPFADNLVGDLTGDGTDDVAVTATSFLHTPSIGSGLFTINTTIDGQNYQATGGTLVGSNSVIVTGVTMNTQPEGTSAAVVHVFPITFTDPGYGAVGEDGFVEVFLRADDTMLSESRIELRRLVFDPDQRGTPGFNQNQSYPEAQRIPEPASLALLGLGWLILLRRRHESYPYTYT